MIGHVVERANLKLPKQTGEVERDADDGATGYERMKECASLS